LLQIAVLIVDSLDREGVIPTSRFNKACVIYRYFNLTSFDAEQHQLIRYKMLLDFMLSKLKEVSEQFGWPAKVFDDAYEKVIATGFVNEYLLLAPKYSPNKMHRASIRAQVGKDYSVIVAECHKTDGTVLRGDIVKVARYESDFDFVNKFRWLDNDELLISNREDEIHFKYSFKDQAMEVLLTPKTHDEVFLMDELRLLNPETSRTESLSILNKRINGLAEI
jgi:hypothetical protein